MSHLRPLDTPAVQDQFASLAARQGFIPNSLRTMARRPEVADAFMGLVEAISRSAEVETDLRHLVAVVASAAAGCRYCQTHQAAAFVEKGGDPAKVAAVWEFERSPLFDERERAALRLAHDAATVPNAVDAGHFVALGAHFSEGEVVDLVAVISLFGFLNRWNDTMATQLEEQPLGIGRSVGIDPREARTRRRVSGSGPRAEAGPHVLRRSCQAVRNPSAIALRACASAWSVAVSSRPASPRDADRIPLKKGPKASARNAPGSSSTSTSGRHGDSAPSGGSRNDST